jgi:hypothetical protein
MSIVVGILYFTGVNGHPQKITHTMEAAVLPFARDGVMILGTFLLIWG